MAKKKRTHTKIASPKKNISQTEQERCYVVAKKLLRHFELEPELIDVFSKKQKLKLFKKFFEPPIVKPAKINTVPRQYVKNIHTEMYLFMKTNFFGNPENQLTYMELATYGLNFLLNLSNMHVRDAAFIQGTPQEEVAKQICEKYDIDEFFYDIAFTDVLERIWDMTRSYSKINFRFYGFKLNYDEIPQSCGCCTNMKMTIRLTAQDSEIKKFTINNIERKAFRMLTPALGIYKPSQVTVFRNKIFPNTKEDDLLEVYIQSHALHRFKERIDSSAPSFQNFLIQSSFTNGMHLVPFAGRALFSCLIDEKNPIGYFTHFVQDNNLIVNTFIPLTSEGTPEGKKLHELLPLSKEDIIYLGMDKISFYLNIDFEQIPKLKQALIDSGIWETKLALDQINERETIEIDRTTIDEKKTMFIKNFFDKREQYSTDILLREAE